MTPRELLQRVRANDESIYDSAEEFWANQFSIVIAGLIAHPPEGVISLTDVAASPSLVDVAACLADQALAKWLERFEF